MHINISLYHYITIIYYITIISIYIYVLIHGMEVSQDVGSSRCKAWTPSLMTHLKPLETLEFNFTLHNSHSTDSTDSTQKNAPGYAIRSRQNTHTPHSTACTAPSSPRLQWHGSVWSGKSTWSVIWPMTDPWCCYIWCSMDPINIPQLC